MSLLDPGIIAEFFAEGNEHLDTLESCLLKLEGAAGAGDQDAIDRSFRAAHSIKGAAGFLGLEAVEKVMHAAEDLLDLVRKGKASLDSTNAGALLRAGDRCRALLEAARNGQETPVESVMPMVAALRELVVAPSPSAVAPAPSAPAVAAPGAVAGPAAPLTRAPRVPKVVPPAGATPAPVDAPAPAAVPAASSGAASVPSQPSVVPLPSLAAVSSLPRVATPPAPLPAAASPAAAPPASPAPVALAPAIPPAPTESRLEGAADPNVGTIRVDVGLLDDIVNLVGELVVARNRLVQVVGEKDDRTLALASRRVDHLTSDLQNRVMKTRMRPVAVAWGALPRLVRDVAASTGKLVSVEMVGQETELDRGLLEVIKDPLSHMIRNCVDHGIELPSDRVSVGKPASGTITLKARHSGGQVLVEVSDDGRGIQVEKVRKRAIANGLVTEDAASALDAETLLQFVFQPGFSTAETISNLSGRGVGMDVVKTSVEKAGGSVDIRSVPGRGTTIRIKLPLTLAIVPALITLVGERRFCVPQANLVEIVDLMTADARGRVEWLAGTPLFRLRGQLLPLVPLGGTLELSHTDALSGYIVVVDADDLRFGMVVDDIQHTEEIVVKPVGAEIKRVQVFSGATVLGDGSVALIVDVVSLARRGRVAARTRQAQAQARDGERKDVQDVRTLLRLDVAGFGMVAVDVGSVLRIDDLASAEVFRHAGDTVFRYLDRVVPVRRLADGDGPVHQIVVCEHGEVVIGIAVTEVLDVVSTAVKVTPGMGASWAEGVGFVNGQPTAMLDVRRLDLGRSA